MGRVVEMRIAVAFAITAMLAACAADKKIPPPPRGSLVDVSQPVDLSRPRQLLEAIPDKTGLARKVDAYSTPEDCTAVQKFYNESMQERHWTALTHEESGKNEFAQSWRYMSRNAYIAGAASSESAGCTIITAIYSRGKRTHYDPK